MDTQRLSQLLRGVERGEVTIEAAVERLRLLPYEDLGFAQPDHHRTLRTGFPEVIFGMGKTPEQIALIAKTITAQSDLLLVTRASAEAYELVRRDNPEARYHERAGTIVVDRRPPSDLLPGVLLVSAGTADLPVAEEAAVTAELLGSQVERLNDVGVAGVHRLLDRLPLLHRARVIIVVAGMEGALPSLVGGLVSAPVVAVPTSIGYGASFGGLAALLAMLNSCAPGIAVVNIDNGFGAGYLAGTINALGQRP
jgi:NCAIR mutase (PurE)-related protein